MLHFHVRDGISYKDLIKAKVSVYDAADTTFLANSQFTLYIDDNRIDTMGIHAVVPRRPVYLVHVEMPEYEPVWRRVEVPERQYIKVPTRSWNVKVEMFKRRIYQLGEATVTASRILMVTKGDTVEFNAAALQMADGDMLSGLVEALPGVRIGDGGRITYNGQFVSSLLVNGREFFQGSPQVALQNLPAYTVKKIQIYHDASGRMPEPGLKKALPRETDPLVMDVRLKREYAESWLAQVGAGGGRELGSGGDGIYQARFFAMRFTPVLSFVTFGNFNNYSDQSEAAFSKDGRWTYYDGRMPENGNVTSQVGGASLSYEENLRDGRDEIGFSGSLRALHSKAEQAEQSAGEAFLEGGNTFSRSRDRSNTERTAVRWNNNFRYSLNNNKTWFWLQTFVASYTHFANRSLSQAAAFSADPQDAYLGASLDSLFSPVGSDRLTGYLINRQQQARLGRYDDYNVHGNGYITMHDPWWGRIVRLTLGGAWQRRDEETFLLDDVRYGAPQPDGSDGYRQDRYTKLPTKRFNYNVGLDFDLLSKFVARKYSYTLNLSYQFAQRHEQGERSLWRLDQLPGWNVTADSLGSWDHFEQLLRPGAGDLDNVLDLNNTYRTTEDQKDHTLTLNWNYPLFGPEIEFSAALPAVFRRSHIEDLRARTPRQLTRHDILLQPRLGFTVKQFSLNYNFSQATPSLLHLLDVRDDSNPLYVSYGNSHLRNTKTHNLRAGYDKSYSRRQRSFYVNASYNKVNDQVSIAQTYDRATGRRTSMPLNVDGTWGTSLGAGYGQTLDRADKLYFDLSTNAGLTHNVGFLSDTEVLGQGRQAVDNLLWHGNLRLDYRVSSRTRLTGRADFSWRYMDSDRPDFATLRTTDFSYGLELTTQLPGRIDLWTEIAMTSRRGYLDASMNDDCLIWSAYVSRSFGPKRQRAPHPRRTGTHRDPLQHHARLRTPLPHLPLQAKGQVRAVSRGFRPTQIIPKNQGNAPWSIALILFHRSENTCHSFTASPVLNSTSISQILAADSCLQHPSAYALALSFLTRNVTRRLTVS